MVGRFHIAVLGLEVARLRNSLRRRFQRRGQCCMGKFMSSSAGIMFEFRSAMIHSEPATTMVAKSTPKRQRQDVIGVIRTGRDMQEKDYVNAYLGDGQHD